jgi:hypothetical protein
MTTNLKKIVALLTLIYFVGMVFFSFAFMSVSHNGSMTDECPFSAVNKSWCGLNSILSIIHHIGAYSSFTNIPLPFFLSLFLLLLGAINLVCFQVRLILAPPLKIKILSNFLDNYFVDTKIYRWLSLFENSPSLLLRA